MRPRTLLQAILREGLSVLLEERRLAIGIIGGGCLDPRTRSFLIFVSHSLNPTFCICALD
jgi:hypothetical protein